MLVSSHLLAEVALSVDEVIIVAHGRLVIQSSLAELPCRATVGVRVRTPQAEALWGALAASGTAAELRTRKGSRSMYGVIGWLAGREDESAARPAMPDVGRGGRRSGRRHRLPPVLRTGTDPGRVCHDDPAIPGPSSSMR